MLFSLPSFRLLPRFANPARNREDQLRPLFDRVRMEFDRARLVRPGNEAARLTSECVRECGRPTIDHDIGRAIRTAGPVLFGHHITAVHTVH